jgi:hypothetical protein
VSDEEHSMVVGVGEVAIGGQRKETDGPTEAGPKEAAGPARPAGPFTRRGLLRALIAPAFALAVTPLVVASRSTHTTAGGDGQGAGAFDETYRGRRIRGVPVAGTRTAGGEQWRVTVDGRPLHLMRRADGTWLSVVDHYGSHATPLEAARAAVDALGPGEQLRRQPLAHGRHHHTGGGEHGVHA